MLTTPSKRPVMTTANYPAAAHAFCGCVPDLVMVDRSQADLVDALARARNLFGPAASWPRLDTLFHDYSQFVLGTQGETYWLQQGGIYGPDGQSTLRPDSRLAGYVVDDAAQKSGGILCEDQTRTQWAVRLVPMPNRPADYRGFAIQYPGAVATAAATAPGSTPSTPLCLPHLDSGRATRAAQVYMAIHTLVLQQRSSVVVVPDVLLGQLAWGGDQSQWPRNWRQDRWEVLAFLSQLRSGVLRLAGEGWRPRFVAHSTALASVEDLRAGKPGEDRCSPACPMWNSNRPTVTS